MARDTFRYLIENLKKFRVFQGGLIKALGNPGKETKEPFFQIKAHDLSNFYMRSSTFDLSKLIIAMERFRENPLELSPSEEAYLDDFYLNLYSAIPGTDKS